MRIKEHLRAKRIRQTALAHDLGVSQSTISQWVTGGRPIPTQYLRAFAERAEIAIEHLVPPATTTASPSAEAA